MSFRNGIDTTYRNKFRARGGAGDFSWEQLRGDKRAATQEYYLGRSEKCEHIWYRDDQVGKKRRRTEDEKAAIREQEDAAMRQALGLAPKEKPQKELSQHAVRQALQRGGGDDDGDEERALGLGLNKTLRPSMQYVRETGHLPEGMQDAVAGEVERQPRAAAAGPTMPEEAQSGGAAGGAAADATIPTAGAEGFDFSAAQRRLSKDEMRLLKKLKKKEKKEKKKEKKKAKKEKKKEKKRKRRRSSSSDSSSSSSSS